MEVLTRKEKHRIINFSIEHTAVCHLEGLAHSKLQTVEESLKNVLKFQFSYDFGNWEWQWRLSIFSWMRGPDFSEASHWDISTFTWGTVPFLSSRILPTAETDVTLIFCAIWQFGLLLSQNFWKRKIRCFFCCCRILATKIGDLAKAQHGLNGVGTGFCTKKLKIGTMRAERGGWCVSVILSL